MTFRLLAPFTCVIAISAACQSSPNYVDPESDSDAGADASSERESERPIEVQRAGIEPNTDWRPLPRDVSLDGKTLDALAVEWAHWNLSQSDCNNNAESDPDGALCTLDQGSDAPVFFLAPGAYATVRTRCSIGTDQSILVPLTYFYADGLSHPFGINTPADGLEDEARAIQGTMRDLKLVVDGLSIEDLEAFQVGPSKFSQTLPRTHNRYSCSGSGRAPPETVDPIYLVGYFALLPPPRPGKHRLEFGGTYSYVGWDYVNRISFTFTAE